MVSRKKIQGNTQRNLRTFIVIIFCKNFVKSTCISFSSLCVNEQIIYKPRFSFTSQKTVRKSTIKRNHDKDFREINFLVKTLISRKNVDFSVKIVIAFVRYLNFSSTILFSRKNDVSYWEHVHFCFCWFYWKMVCVRYLIATIIKIYM